MPLRDHFHPPVIERRSWSGLYGGWPAMAVQDLFDKLPADYHAGPRIRLWFEDDDPSGLYEVRITDDRRRRLVAVVRFICPANKDRPERRRAVAGQCAELIRDGVSVVLVDPVTSHDANVCADVIELLGRADPGVGPGPPSLYIASFRPGQEPLSIVTPMTLGRPLPAVSLWLDGVAFSLSLEVSYEETCRILRIA